MNKLSAAQAVELLIQEYGKLVFHTIYAMCGNWEESQDLTQDTFHNALRAIDAARASSGDAFHAKAWLLRIAVNTVRMQRRRQNILRFIPFSQLWEDQAQETENEALSIQPVQPAGYNSGNSADPAELVAEQDAVQRTLQRLPEPMRVCLLLSIVGGLSNAEIANLLDLKEAAVRQRLTRARKQFQQLYQRESGEEVLDSSSSTSNHENEHTHAMRIAQDGVEYQVLNDTSPRPSLAAHPPVPRRSYA